MAKHLTAAHKAKIRAGLLRYYATHQTRSETLEKKRISAQNSISRKESRGLAVSYAERQRVTDAVAALRSHQEALPAQLIRISSSGRTSQRRALPIVGRKVTK